MYTPLGTHPAPEMATAVDCMHPTGMYSDSDVCGLYIQDMFVLLQFSHFASARGAIERAFGILKSSYCSVGTHRFRSRRHLGPLICNLTAAMQNRTRIMFCVIRQKLFAVQ